MMEVAEMVQDPVREERYQRAQEIAADKFRDGPDWVTFYREVLGQDGIVDQLFPGERRGQFEKTVEFAQIQQMLAKLREKNRGQKLPDEATRVITVRLPKSLHESLRHEAHHHKTSMNKLCISKLLQVIDGELVPSDFERRPESGNGSKKQRLEPAMQVADPVADPAASQAPPTTAQAEPSTQAMQPMMADALPGMSPPNLEMHSRLPSPTAPTAGAF
jgi:predicted HicB family RNase H-like nuclease